MTPTFKNLPLKAEHLLLVLTVALLSVIAYFINGDMESTLVYHRQLIEQGEYWRLITGHFLHTNGYHLLLNLAALSLLWALHGQFYTIQNYALLFFSSALICSAGLYFLSPEIRQYVGLSGVLHGIFIFGAIMDIKHHDKTGYLLFAGVWLKIAHEQIYGASEDVSTLIDASVAIDAHLWGGVGGLIFSVIYFVYLRYASKTK